MEDRYDVFISYSHKDEDWVQNWLLARLEAAGLKVCIDFRDFDLGASALDNMEQAATISNKTLLVMTPNWVASEWSNFEALLTQTQDPAARRRRLIPLMLQKSDLPPRLAMLTYANFTNPEKHEAELQRVVSAIKQGAKVPEMPKGATTSANLNATSSQTPSIATEPESYSQEFLTRLRELLIARFSDNELKTLCFDMGIDYENISGSTKSAHAIELIRYLRSRDRLGEFLKLCQRERPTVNWFP